MFEKGSYLVRTLGQWNDFMSTESGEKSKQKVEIKVSRGTEVKDCIYF